MAKKVTIGVEDMIRRGRMLEAGQGIFPGWKVGQMMHQIIPENWRLNGASCNRQICVQLFSGLEQILYVKVEVIEKDGRRRPR